MQSIQHILWPTDASESALAALRTAVVLAEKFAARIHALQVVDQVPRLAQAGFAGDPLQTFDFSLYEVELVKYAREGLVKTVQKTVPDTVDTEIHVELGSPKESIISFCANHEIDLVVMATHGREGLPHLLLGSVAEATVRRSPVPVLVVPPPGD